MTYSLIAEPFQYNPVNAPLWIVADSPDAAIGNGWNYIFRLWAYNNNNLSEINFLGEYKIPPRPDRTGVFDIEKIIKSLVVTDYNENGNIMTHIPFSNPVGVDYSLIPFIYKYGYSQDIEVSFSSTGKVSSYVVLSSVTGATSSFNIGDQIVIKMSNNTLNSDYNGSTTITGFSGSTGIITDTIFGVTESNIGGKITNITRILGTSSVYTGVNGTRQYWDPNFNNSTTHINEGYSDFYINNNYIFGLGYNPGTTYSQNFLTSYSQDRYKEIFASSDCGSYDQFEITYFLGLTHSDVINRIITYDINMNLLDTYETPSTYQMLAPYSIYFTPTGTANLSPYVDFTNVSYYTVQVVDDLSSDENYLICRRKIVKNCSVYPNVRLMFLNRVGGYDFYNFNYDSKISMNINRTEFNKTLDWNYQIGQRGRTVLTIEAETQTIINTDWVSEYDYNFLQELVTSPEVFVIVEEVKYNETTGRNNCVYINRLPIIITDTTWEQKTILREKIFNMSLTFKYAFDTNLQSK